MPTFGPALPDPKPAKLPRIGLLRRRRKARTAEERNEQAAWRMHVLTTTLPLYTPTAFETRASLEAHHIIPRQVCRKNGAPEWDKRNGVAVSQRRHDRHPTRHEPIGRWELPGCVFDFAREFNLTWYLDKHYKAPVAA